MSIPKLIMTTLLLAFIVAIVYSVPEAERTNVLTLVASVLAAVGAVLSSGGRGGGDQGDQDS